VLFEVSRQGAPGGAGHHATYFYGSPVAERAAIEFVREKLLAKLFAVPVVPADVQGRIALLDELRAYVEGLALDDKEVFRNISDPAGWVAGGHFRAPTTAGFAAARNAFLALLQFRKLHVRFGAPPPPPN